MHRVKLRALRPLRGDYGRVDPGDIFVTDDRTAEDFELRGLAELYRPPAPVFSMAANAILASPENKATLPERTKRRRAGR